MEYELNLISGEDERIWDWSEIAKYQSPALLICSGELPPEAETAWVSLSLGKEVFSDPVHSPGVAFNYFSQLANCHLIFAGGLEDLHPMRVPSYLN